MNPLYYTGLRRMEKTYLHVSKTWGSETLVFIYLIYPFSCPVDKQANKHKQTSKWNVSLINTGEKLSLSRAEKVDVSIQHPEMPAATNQ